MVLPAGFEVIGGHLTETDGDRLDIVGIQFVDTIFSKVRFNDDVLEDTGGAGRDFRFLEILQADLPHVFRAVFNGKDSVASVEHRYGDGAVLALQSMELDKTGNLVYEAFPDARQGGSLFRPAVSVNEAFPGWLFLR